MAKAIFDMNYKVNSKDDVIMCAKESLLCLDIRFTRGKYAIERHGGWIDLQCAQDTLVMPHKATIIPLGINLRVPCGYETIIAPRSSTCLNHGIMAGNSIGIIEEDYCGNLDELGLVAVNFTDEPVTIEKGLRICQFKVVRAMPEVHFNLVSDMGNANRGGYGSTGL